jgi:hypothetical protein
MRLEVGVQTKMTADRVWKHPQGPNSARCFSNEIAKSPAENFAERTAMQYRARNPQQEREVAVSREVSRGTETTEDTSACVVIDWRCRVKINETGSAPKGAPGGGRLPRQHQPSRLDVNRSRRGLYLGNRLNKDPHGPPPTVRDHCCGMI